MRRSSLLLIFTFVLCIPQAWAASYPSARHRDFLLKRGFEISDHLLGSGTYGSVYLGQTESRHEPVAIKIAAAVTFDEEHSWELEWAWPDRCNLRDGAVCVRAQGARHLVATRALLQHDDRQLTVMDFYPWDLSKYLKEQQEAGGLKWQAFVTIMRGVYEGLLELRAMGLQHRDLKPANVLLDGDDVPSVVKITDFGLARQYGAPELSGQTKPNREVLTDPSLTSEVITLWYRPPEILLGTDAYGHEADLWSLGCIAWELLTGHRAFKGDSQIDQLFKIFKAVGRPEADRHTVLTKLPHYNAQMPKFNPPPLAEQLRPLVKLRDANDSDVKRAVLLVTQLLDPDPAQRALNGDLHASAPWLWEGVDDNEDSQPHQPDYRHRDRARLLQSPAQFGAQGSQVTPHVKAVVVDWLLDVAHCFSVE